MHSKNYERVKSHYQSLLSQHYTWSFSGPKYQTELFETLGLIVEKGKTKIALDLGCGSGFQAIPLALLGWQVIAIDSSPHLLGEMARESDKRGLSITGVEGDMLNLENLLKSTRVDLIVCMGDSLTHLATLEEVKILLKSAFDALCPGATMLLQFRDLTTPLVDGDRFIPIKSDERTVFTCFLEWEPLNGWETNRGSGRIIKVHDLVHVKKGIGYY